jgi:tellurite resistance protein TerC
VRSDWRLRARLLARPARRMAVALAGGAVVALGMIFLLTPGPGLLVIPAGLGILALEFETPRRWQRHLRERIRELRLRMALRRTAPR